MSKNAKSSLGQRKKAEAKRLRLEQEFMEFASRKGWDEDRRIQVLAELAYSDPWHEILDECVQAGWTDGLIQQLYDYYGGEDIHYARLLQKIVGAEPTAVLDYDLVIEAIETLSEIKETSTDREESGVA